MRRRAYLIRKGLQFLQCMYDPAGFEFDPAPDKLVPKYTVYKFDAARIRRVTDAVMIMQLLQMRTEDELSIVRFDTLTGEVQELP